MIATAQRRIRSSLNTARQATVGRGVTALWAALPPAGRIALGGVLASAAVAVALGIFIPLEIRQHLLVAESRGLRLQAAILAIVIPALFLYLVAVNPELVAPVTSTALGQLVLLPAAVVLEIAGIVLSWRVTRLEG